jgi:flagellin-like protein
MRLQRLLDDDDAVSPVIGVILMVAITVILAAVIASFVLGLGDRAGNVSPQASFSSDYDETSGYGGWSGNLTITHNSGDSVVSDQVFLRGSGFDDAGGNQTWAGYQENSSVVSSVSGSTEGSPAVAAGDRIEIGADSNYRVRIVWESAEGDSSNTFVETSGPNA